MTTLAEQIAEAYLPRSPELAVSLKRVIAAPVTANAWGEPPSIRGLRRAALQALGIFCVRLELRAIRFVLQRLPDSAKLIEMGTGLDPLEWIHNAGPGTGRYDVVVQCTGATQRANVESQLDGAGIAHERPPPTALEWWTTTGSALFPGATEATWEIALAYADTQSQQLWRLIDGASSVDAFRTLIEGRAAARQSVFDELEAE